MQVLLIPGTLKNYVLVPLNSEGGHFRILCMRTKAHKYFSSLTSKVAWTSSSAGKALHTLRATRLRVKVLDVLQRMADRQTMMESVSTPSNIRPIKLSLPLL